MAENQNPSILDDLAAIIDGESEKLAQEIRETTITNVAKTYGLTREQAQETLYVTNRIIRGQAQAAGMDPRIYLTAITPTAKVIILSFAAGQVFQQAHIETIRPEAWGEQL